jgi:predicted CopG family antitoxin
MTRKLKMIAISEENYQILKKKGSAGDSFNDVLTPILQREETTKHNKGE